MTEVKICGLSTPETVDAAVRAGAQHIGFVFFPKSPRHVELAQVEALAARVPAHVGRVGVFVDPDDGYLQKAVAAGRLRAVQLHGHEGPERIAAVKALLPEVAVWKAVSVATSQDIAESVAQRGPADLLLFDAKAPNGAALPGGNGVRFDWRLLVGQQFGGPWGLSGGLTPEILADAISATGAPLVDVSSGVESAPGVKSVALIEAFCKAAGCA